MILIAPDHSIIDQDIWPISTADDFTPFFSSHGINPFSAGVLNISNENAISIFPSPAKNQITLSVSGKKINTVKLFDMLGNTVLNQTFLNTQQNVTLDISNFTSGIYYAEANINNAELIIKKFVKE